MSNTVTTVIAINANTQAAIAQAEARKAKKISCMDLEAHFKGTETLEVKKQYADCINFLYPNSPLDPSTILVLKAALVIAFISGAIGSVMCYRDGFGDIADGAIGFIFGFLCGPLAVAGILGLIWSLGWLFNLV